jgi:integrase
MTSSALTVAAPVENFAAILSTMDASVSESTTKAYSSAWRKFSVHFESRGWDLFPVTVDDSGEYLQRVASYLQSLADADMTLSTINKHLSGVKYYASRQSQLGFMVLNGSRELKAMMSGFARQTKAVQVRKAKSLTVEQITALHLHLCKRRTVRNLRNRALIALGIGAALRSQSIADLNISDVTSALAVDGLNVRVRWSKTDQTGEGRSVTVRRSSHKTVDPVRAVTEWMDYLRAHGITPEGTPDAPLFPHVRGTSVQVDERLINASDAVTHIVRGVLIDAGIVEADEVQAYSSHSLRSTFITLSAQSGVSEAKVAAISGHKNLTVLRGYDRTSEELAAQTNYLNG